MRFVNNLKLNAMSNYPAKVYLNGDIVDYQDAKISVFDRGFLFGDGVYEVMNQVNGSYFYGQEHLDRLEACLMKIGIKYDVSSLSKKIDELVDVTNLKEQDHLLYIQITRGVAPRKHAFPSDATPTLMMYAIPFELPEINPNHHSVVTVPDNRWHRCDIKVISLLGNVMANDFATKNGAFETAFVRGDKVTEASHCNLFFVKDNVVYTHPADENILAGITRNVVLQLCKKLDIKYQEKAVLKKDIATMDEAFLTGTTTQVASIRKIDDIEFYERENVGEITRRLQEGFLRLKAL